MSALSSSGAASASASGAASASAAAPVSAASSSVAPNYRFVSATSSAAGSKAIAVLKFSPDGTLVAAAGADATLRVFRVGESVDSEGETIPTLLPLFERPAAHDAGINDIAFTHDARYILTASDDKTVVIWEVESGQPLRTYSGHTSYVFCLAVSGSGNLLVTGSYDESVKVWDLKNAKCTRTISAHSDPVSAVDFNRDGSLIVSSSYDGLWSAINRQASASPAERALEREETGGNGLYFCSPLLCSLLCCSLHSGPALPQSCVGHLLRPLSQDDLQR